MAKERKNPWTGQTHITPSDLTSKRILVFDLETTELAPQGRSPQGLKVSIGSVKDLLTGKKTSYGEDEVGKLIEHLYTGDLVTGYNINDFDLKVLQDYTKKNLANELPIVDMADVIHPAWVEHGNPAKVRSGQGWRKNIPSLRNILDATGLAGKLGTGAGAPELYKQGLLEELRRYVERDTDVEGALFEYVVRHGNVSFFIKDLGKVTANLNIPVPGLGRTTSFFAGKPPPPTQGGAVFNTPNSPIGGNSRRNRTFEWLRHGIEDFDKIGISNKSITAHIWNFAKAFEESLGTVPRTFELSTISSVFATRGKGTKITISPEALRASRYYYSELLGRTLVEDDFQKGLIFQGRKVFLGEEEIRGHFSAVQRHWRSSAENHAPFFSRIARAYETARGYRAIPLLNLKDPQPYQSGANFIIVGAKTKLGLLGRHLEAGAITLSQRYFRLLDDPIEGVGAFLGREGEFSLGLNKRAPAIMKAYNYAIRNRLGLGRAVDKELGGLGSQWLRHSGQLAKYLIGGAFAYHLVDNFMEDTIGLGISGIGAKLYQGANLALSTLSYVTGLTAIRRAQEKVSPDSTSKLAVLAYPVSGAITGAVIAGAFNARDRFKFGPAALERISEKTPFKGLMSLVFKNEYTRIGRFARTGGAIGAIASALISLPFGIGSIGHKYTPGELLDIYRGKEEVPVRKARFWEFGRCLISTTYVFTENGFKQAKDINIQDRLLSVNQLSPIKEIYTKNYDGPVISLTSAIDKSIATTVTPNHIIPVIKRIYDKTYTIKKHLVVQELPAEEITLGDYVEVPIQHFSEDCKSIKTVDFIYSPVFISEEYVYAAQRSRYSGKLIKSGGKPIPAIIELDEEIGWLLGIFLAEGNISFGYNTERVRKPQFIETVHSIHERWIAERIIDIISRRFGITGSIKHRTNFSGCIEGALIVRICNTILAELLYNLLYNQEDKWIPDLLLKTDKSFKLALLEGYWNGDGHLDGPAKVISSARSQLIYQCHRILLDIGIFSSISFEENDYAGKYRLRWSKVGIEENGLRYFWYESRLFVEIIKIEAEEYSGLVYDFEVEDNSHLFKAGSFLIHNSPWQGGQIQYYRPHWSVVAQTRYKEKALFDKDESFLFRAIKQTEILKDIVAPYYLEDSHGTDRPYPIAVGHSTGLGPLSAIYNLTLAKLFKPQRFQYVDKWQSGDDLSLWGTDRDAAGIAASVDYTKRVTLQPGNLLAESENLAQRVGDAFGLPGFVAESLNENILGRRTWLGQQAVLQPSADMNSMQRNFWDLNLGGGATTTEFIRRLIPPKRAQAMSINTIPNTSMPSWIPDTYMKLHQGDPFTKLLQGELRLPGKGFGARYPELTGTSPEDYPLAYRAKILSDIAPFSHEFEILKEQGLAYSAEMSSREQFIFNQALKQAETKRNERLFADDPENIFQWLHLKIKTIGRMNPIEHLIPLAPIHKFAGPISAIEDYKLNMIYSKEFTSWAHPFDSFVFPALRVAAHNLGWDGIPRDIKEKRVIQEYFDRLEYLKYKTLARQAPFTGDPMESTRYALASQKTLTGLNPFGTESNIYQALEGREEYYYIPFRNETNPRKQQKILELIPDQYKKIYRAAWAEKAAMSGDKEAIKQLALLKQAEGEEINDDLIHQYKAETGNENLKYYAEWKRLQDTQEFFLENGLALPDKNWAGFDPRVRMNDVKMRYVMEHGKDIHDFDLWESDQIGIDSRPWSAQAAEQLENPDTRNPNILSMNLQSMFHTLGFRNINVSVEEIIGFNRPSEVDMEFEHDRSRYTNPMAKFGY